MAPRLGEQMVIGPPHPTPPTGRGGKGGARNDEHHMETEGNIDQIACHPVVGSVSSCRLWTDPARSSTGRTCEDNDSPLATSCESGRSNMRPMRDHPSGTSMGCPESESMSCAVGYTGLAGGGRSEPSGMREGHLTVEPNLDPRSISGGSARR